MSDESAEDSDAASGADGTSPAGSTDSDTREDDATSTDSDESASSERGSDADITDSDEETDAEATTDVEPGRDAGVSDDAAPGEDAVASDDADAVDGDDPDAVDVDDPDDVDDETTERDLTDANSADADATDGDATVPDADDPASGPGPGSARARMGSQPPDPSDDDGRVSHHDPDDFGRAPGADETPDADADETPDADAGDRPDAPGTPDDRSAGDRDPDSAAAPYDPEDGDGPADARGSAPRASAHARGGASATGDGGASASGTATTDADGGGSSGGILSGGIGGSAPPDDEEMPLTEHIEEMFTRLGIVVVVAAFATLAAFPVANDLIIHMWYDVHYGTVEACKTAPQSDGCVAPHVYGPLELVLTRIRVAGLAGLLVALPLAVYQTYRFMRPGLYPQERRYFLSAVPFSLVLGIVGMVFAYFVMLPLLFAYFISYTQGTADLAFQLAETMNLILLMMGMLAIIFQIPLLIMLAIMMGITTRRWLERRRLYFWGLFLGVAVIFGPDPTGMAPFLLTATMVVLFEGTLLLLRWTGR